MTDTPDQQPADPAVEAAPPPPPTLVSATWGNADSTLALVETAERGIVAVAPDRPELWGQLQEAIGGGFVVAPFVPHVIPPPDEISDRQFFQGLAMRGLITETEAIAAVATGTIPAAMAAFIDALPQTERFAARMILCGATTFSLKHPLTLAFATMQGMDTATLADFWRFCAAL